MHASCSKVGHYDAILMLAKSCVLLLMFNSLRLYFTWKIPDTLIYTLGIISFCLIISHRNNIWTSQRNLLLCGFLFLVQLYELFFAYNFSFPIFLRISSALLCGCIMILANIDLKKDLLVFITKATAVIVSISLFGWVLFLLGVPLLHYYSNTDAYYNHTVYHLFLLNGVPEQQFVTRFAGFFLEPGHLGTTCCFLLFVNRFDLKRWENLVFLAAVLFSLSLAAYGLLIGGALLFLCLHSKHGFLYGLVFALFVSIISFFIINLNKEENVIYQSVLSRLEYSDGDIAGNNRYSQFFDKRYDSFIESDNRYLGIRRDTFTKNESQNWTLGSAGWKRYVLTRGVIGTVLVILFYFIYLMKNWSISGFGLFLLFLTANMIRDYPLSEYWLFIYLLAIPLLRIKKRNMLNVV